MVLTRGVRTPSDALVGPISVGALRKLHADVVVSDAGMVDDACATLRERVGELVLVTPEEAEQS